MSKAKLFLGSQAMDHVALYALFPGSPVEVIALTEFDETWPLVVVGPEFQLDKLNCS